jgi:hypothetical protein
VPTTASEPEGILNPGAIDSATTDADGRTTLHVAQTCEWDGSDQLLLLVQEKLFNYLTFVADGELARRYPRAARQWRVQMDCWSEPDARMRTLFDEAGAQFRSLGGSFDVTVRLPPPPPDR